MAEYCKYKNNHAKHIRSLDLSKDKAESADETEPHVDTSERAGAEDDTSGKDSKLPQASAAEAATSESQSPAAETGEDCDSERQLAQLEADKHELKEALLRKQADFENYRRRMQKDKEEAIQFANRSLIAELLEVLDNFERALASHQEEKDSSPAMQGLFEGLELVEKQLSDLLSAKGLKAMDCVGQEFDPNRHEALMMEESMDCKVATVVENFQTGYLLHERVLRPARVKVAKPAN